MIVATCYLTKWVEVHALKSKECEQIAQFFFNSIMVKHNSPIKILNDNRSEFCIALLKVLAIHLHTKHTTRSPYHPQCNSLTKRFKMTLCLLIEKNGEYDQYWHTMLSAIVFAYRTTVHSSTRFLLFEMLYRRKPRLPIVLLAPALAITQPTDLHTWLDELLQQRD